MRNRRWDRFCVLAIAAAAAVAAGCGGEPPDSAAPPASVGAPGWTDWRGPGRAAVSADVPLTLPAKVKLLWRQPLSGLGLSGVSATADRLIVADKDAAKKKDIWRCLRARDGKEIWKLTYLAAGDMDYSNSPRAQPVIHDGLAYLLGAFGDLHCVRLDNGRIRWRMNIVKRFGAERPKWGMCATPLVVDDKLVVNPGAPKASVVALDRRTGKVIWACPGRPAAYSSFIVGTFGGVRQVVGYDANTVGGWDVTTGKRLWTLVPPEEGDFNVPTPVAAGGRILLTTENNGTRLYAFDDAGRIRTKPVGRYEDLANDTQTPVVLDELVFGSCGVLFCLDLTNKLEVRWEGEDRIFEEFSVLIAGNGRLLVLAVDGQLALVTADGKACRILARRKLYGEEETEIWSHPALVGDRLYVRNDNSIACFLLK